MRTSDSQYAAEALKNVPMWTCVNHTQTITGTFIKAKQSFSHHIPLFVFTDSRAKLTPSWSDEDRHFLYVLYVSLQGPAQGHGDVREKAFSHQHLVHGNVQMINVQISWIN